MPERIFQIWYRTLSDDTGTRETRKGIGQVQDAIQGLTGINLQSMLSMAGVGVAINQLVTKAVQKFNEETEALASLSDQVQMYAAASGVSNYEAEKMIMFADSLGVSTNTLDTIFRKMSQNGIQPTIENLIDLARQYQSIEDPVARAQYAIQNFGKADQEATKIIAENIPTLEAVNENLNTQSILLDEVLKKAAELNSEREKAAALDKQAKAARGYENADFAITLSHIKEEGDQTTILRTNLMALTDQMSDLGLVTDDYKEAMLYLHGAVTNGDYSIEHFTKMVENLQTQIDAAKVSANLFGMDTSKFWTSGIKEFTLYDAAAEKAVAAADALRVKEQEASNMAMVQFAIRGDLTKTLETNAEKMGELKDKQKEITDEMAKLPIWTDKYKDLQKNLDDNAAAQFDLANQTKETTRQIIFQQAAAGLDGMALLTLAKKMGMIDDASYDVGIAVQTQRGLLNDGKITEEEYATRIDNINKAYQTYIDLPDDEKKKFTLDQYINTFLRTYNLGASAMGSGRGVLLAAANGLDMVVPAGFPNDSYRLNLNVTSGEQVKVVPANGGGGSTGMNIYGDIILYPANGESFSQLLSDLSRNRG